MIKKIVCILFIIISMIFCVGCFEEPNITQERIGAEGYFSSVEYLNKSFDNPGHTIIRFKNNSTYKSKGIRSIQVQGNYLTIYEQSTSGRFYACRYRFQWENR